LDSTRGRGEREREGGWGGGYTRAFSEKKVATTYKRKSKKKKTMKTKERRKKGNHDTTVLSRNKRYPKGVENRSKTKGRSPLSSCGKKRGIIGKKKPLSLRRGKRYKSRMGQEGGEAKKSNPNGASVKTGLGESDKNKTSE